MLANELARRPAHCPALVAAAVCKGRGGAIPASTTSPAGRAKVDAYCNALPGRGAHFAALRRRSSSNACAGSPVPSGGKLAAWRASLVALRLCSRVIGSSPK